jgi:hypothetical protein
MLRSAVGFPNSRLRARGSIEVIVHTPEGKKGSSGAARVLQWQGVNPAQLLRPPSILLASDAKLLPDICHKSSESKENIQRVYIGT